MKHEKNSEKIKMKKGLQNLLIALGVILVVIFAAYRFFVGNYNSMVELDENVNAKWAQVQIQYQRRSDLIPNLVSTVKGYASHESETFVKVTEMRSKAQSVNIDASDLQDAQKFQEFQNAQNQLSAGIRNLLAVAENYPELKANENFLALQDQLEGTENRIAVARTDYNNAVQHYNVFIRKFPQNFVANMNGFLAKQMFAASQEAQSAPKVEF